MFSDKFFGEVYKISDFAKLAGVSAQALRLYERRGLFRPVFVDEASGYRYYTDAQLYTIRQIKQLKAIGMTLSEIKVYIDSGFSLDYELAKLEKLETAVKTRMKVCRLQKKYDMLFPADISTTAGGYFYFKRVYVKEYMLLYDEFESLLAELRDQNLTITKPPTGYIEFPYDIFRENDLDVVLYAKVQPSDNPSVVKLPDVKCLSCISLGNYDNLAKAYSFLQEYSALFGYEKCGSFTEQYFISPFETDEKEMFVTELKMPVK